jgi:flagellar protein FlbD
VFGGRVVIRLHRLDGKPFLLNAELIRTVEQLPDTFVTLVSGERLVVGESMETVLDQVLDYQRSKLLWPAQVAAPATGI